MLTATRLIEPKRIVYTIRASALDAGVLAITAITALAIGLDEAILIGVALSILLFVPRAAQLKASELVIDDEGVVRERLPDDPPCSSLVLYNLEGELFFGAAPELDRYFDELTRRTEAEGTHHIVLRLKRVRHPDVVCLERLEHFLKGCEGLGIEVLLAGVQADLLEAMRRLRLGSGFLTTVFFLRAPTRTQRRWPLSAACTDDWAIPTDASIAYQRGQPAEAPGGSTIGFNDSTRSAGCGPRSS